MSVPFFDLRIHDNALRQELLDAVDRVLQHGKLILGPEVEEFEEEVAKATGSRFAIGLGSGSSALYLALKGAGISAGDEVITTPLTWIITLNAIAACGAKPVCVDIREDFNIDPGAIEAVITKSTRAIVPMHYSGKLSEMDAIVAIADRNNLFVVEDAAQAYGGTYKSKKAGSFSLAGAFSMNPMKVLGGYGEAGAVVTDDEKIYQKIKRLRHAGTTSDPKKKITNECFDVSLNHKIDTIQAAMLLVAMKHLPERMKIRNKIAKKYIANLSRYVTCPEIEKKDVHALYTFAIQAERRDELRAYLDEREIETKIFHYPLACDAPIYSNIQRSSLDTAYSVQKKLLSIPCNETLTEDQVDFVCSSIKDFYQ